MPPDVADTTGAVGLETGTGTGSSLDGALLLAVAELLKVRGRLQAARDLLGEQSGCESRALAEPGWSLWDDAPRTISTRLDGPKLAGE